MVTTISCCRFNDIKKIVEQSIIKVEAQLNSQDLCYFEAKKTLLAGLSFYDISIDPITISRREEDIQADGVSDFFLSLLIQGEIIIRQDDCSVTMNPGDLWINANGQPHVIEYTKPSRRLLLHIPRKIFYESMAGRSTRKITALALGKAGLASIVSSMLKALALEAGVLIEIDQYILKESLLKLIGTLVVSANKAEENCPKDTQTMLLQQVLSYLDKHYCDSDLTPGKVAEANGISMRYLHRIFQKFGVGVSEWIWERRLKAARMDLLDPAKINMRVSEIAFHRGFSSLAHFSRTFRNRFGISPSKLRAKASEEFIGANIHFL